MMTLLKALRWKQWRHLKRSRPPEITTPTEEERKDLSIRNLAESRDEAESSTWEKADLTRESRPFDDNDDDVVMRRREGEDEGEKPTLPTEKDSSSAGKSE